MRSIAPVGVTLAVGLTNGGPRPPPQQALAPPRFSGCQGLRLRLWVFFCFPRLAVVSQAVGSVSTCPVPHRSARGYLPTKVSRY
jgi:hypothetical protein